MKTVGPSDLAKRIRLQSLRMVSRANASHIGACLSATDILAVLYAKILRIDPARPDWPDRDRFILSKGHAAAALYAVLAETGFFPLEWLETYCCDGSSLPGHATATVPGVEVSTGSLGHGLPIACGMALAAKRRNGSSDAPRRVFCLLGDGECDEGSVWEAALFAPQHKLDNLVAIVDRNKLQGFGTVEEVMDLEPLADKWRAFRWSVRELDGHDLRAIEQALAAAPFEPGRPSVIIARTVKGKGVSYMEDQLAWHYRAPDARQLEQAVHEVECAT
jgi:transketolase